MNTPRSGFRRAAAASRALAGLGVAGVAGASALAYADTFKPAPVETPTVATDLAPLPAPTPVLAPPVSDLPVVTTDPAPPVVPQPALERAPAPSQAALPDDTPQHTTPKYVPEYTPQPSETAPAPATHVSPTLPTAKRRTLTPTTVMAPNYSPRITISRGS